MLFILGVNILYIVYYNHHYNWYYDHFRSYTFACNVYIEYLLLFMSTYTLLEHVVTVTQLSGRFSEIFLHKLEKLKVDRVISTNIIIIIIWSPLCKAGREWEHYQSKDPNPTQPTYGRKEIK